MQKNAKVNVAAVIRELLSNYSQEEMQILKPRSIFNDLESRGIQISPTVRSSTSKILRQYRIGKYKNENPVKISTENIANILNVLAKRSNLAVELLNACNGDFMIAKSELDRLLQAHNSSKHKV